MLAKQREPQEAVEDKPGSGTMDSVYCVRDFHISLRKLLVRIDGFIEEEDRNLKSQETQILGDFQSKASLMSNLEQSQ